MSLGSGERDENKVKQVYFNVIDSTVEAARQEFEKSALHFNASAGLKQLRSLWEAKLIAMEDQLGSPEVSNGVDKAPSTPEQILNIEEAKHYSEGYNIKQESTQLSSSYDFSYGGKQRVQGSHLFSSRREPERDTESVTTYSDNYRKFVADGSRHLTQGLNSSRKEYPADRSSNKRARIVEEQKQKPRREDDTKDEVKSEESLDSDFSGSDKELVDSVDNWEVSLLLFIFVCYLL